MHSFKITILTLFLLSFTRADYNLTLTVLEKEVIIYFESQMFRIQIPIGAEVKNAKFTYLDVPGFDFFFSNAIKESYIKTDQIKNITPKVKKILTLKADGTSFNHWSEEVVFENDTILVMFYPPSHYGCLVIQEIAEPRKLEFTFLGRTQEGPAYSSLFSREFSKKKAVAKIFEGTETKDIENGPLMVLTKEVSYVYITLPKVYSKRFFKIQPFSKEFHIFLSTEDRSSGFDYYYNLGTKKLYINYIPAKDPIFRTFQCEITKIPRTMSLREEDKMKSVFVFKETTRKDLVWLGNRKDESMFFLNRGGNLISEMMPRNNKTGFRFKLRNGQIVLEFYSFNQTIKIHNEFPRNFKASENSMIKFKVIDMKNGEVDLSLLRAVDAENWRASYFDFCNIHDYHTSLVDEGILLEDLDITEFGITTNYDLFKNQGAFKDWHIHPEICGKDDKDVCLYIFDAHVTAFSSFKQADDQNLTIDLKFYKLLTHEEMHKQLNIFNATAEKSIAYDYFIQDSNGIKNKINKIQIHNGLILIFDFENNLNLSFVNADRAALIHATDQVLFYSSSKNRISMDYKEQMINFNEGENNSEFSRPNKLEPSNIFAFLDEQTKVSFEAIDEVGCEFRILFYLKSGAISLHKTEIIPNRNENLLLVSFGSANSELLSPRELAIYANLDITKTEDITNYKIDSHHVFLKISENNFKLFAELEDHSHDEKIVMQFPNEADVSPIDIKYLRFEGDKMPILTVCEEFQILYETRTCKKKLAVVHNEDFMVIFGQEMNYVNQPKLEVVRHEKELTVRIMNEIGMGFIEIDSKRMTLTTPGFTFGKRITQREILGKRNQEIKESKLIMLFDDLMSVNSQMLSNEKIDSFRKYDIHINKHPYFLRYLENQLKESDMDLKIEYLQISETSEVVVMFNLVRIIPFEIIDEKMFFIKERRDRLVDSFFDIKEKSIETGYVDESMNLIEINKEKAFHVQLIKRMDGNFSGYLKLDDSEFGISPVTEVRFSNLDRRHFKGIPVIGEDPVIFKI